jgi:hypothetical protein
MAGERLADSATSENKNAEFISGQLPSFLECGFPSCRVSAEAVELALFHSNGVDRLGFQRGGVFFRNQIEHLFFMGQGAVPSLQPSLEKEWDGVGEGAGGDFDSKILGRKA